MRRWHFWTMRWRWLPEFGVHRQSAYFCGGFHLYWLAFAVTYDHLSARWAQRKAA